MYSPLSDQWDAAIRSSGAKLSSLSLYYGGATPIRTDIPIESFSITEDRRSSIRRSGTVVVADPDFLAELKSDTSAFEPYGSEIGLSLGVVHRDSTTESVPMGVFKIESLRWDEGDIAVELDLKDRSASLQRLGPPLTQALPFFGPIQDYVTDILAFYFPSYTVSFDPSLSATQAFPGGTTYDSDLLDIIDNAAALLGAEAYFDRDGVLQFVPVPFVPESLPPGTQDWNVDAADNGVLITASRALSRADTYNNIWVRGGPAASSTPGLFSEQVFGFAADFNAASPTYIYGPFGFCSLLIEKQEITTTADANAYAETVLNNSLGLSKTLEIGNVMNPALDAGDTIQVVYPDGSTEYHLVDSVSFSHSWSSSIQTRTQRVGI